MAKALTALVALCTLVAACGGAPKYTARQAAIDMPAYEPDGHFYDTAYANCVATHLFRTAPPAQVKAAIRGADFGFPSPIVAAAEQACVGI